MRAFGTPLVLDHIARGFGEHPFGSVYKENAVRSHFNLILKREPESNIVTITQGKASDGQPLSGLGVVMRFEGEQSVGPVMFEATGIARGLDTDVKAKNRRKGSRLAASGWSSSPQR